MNSQPHSFDPEVPQADLEEQTIADDWSDAENDSDLPSTPPAFHGVQEASLEDVAEQEIIVEFDDDSDQRSE